MEMALGIDPGERRMGLAISDALGMLAHPLETIDLRKVDPIPRILQIVAERDIGTIVVGIARNMDGSEGPAARNARTWAQQLSGQVSCRVIEWDERLTTSQASRQLHDAGINSRKQRGVIDQAAAAVILQSWLDSQS